jgi:hypothetical protein
MIEIGESADITRIKSFHDILFFLKEVEFKIMKGVDVEEVSTFVKWGEWSETLMT